MLPATRLSLAGAFKMSSIFLLLTYSSERRTATQ